MTAVTARFRAAYRRALRAFLDDGTETSLRAAYELGRDAVTHELGLLDLVHTHHEVLFAELEASPQRDDSRQRPCPHSRWFGAASPRRAKR